MEQLIPAWVDGHLQQVEKLAVHQKGLRHKAVSVFLVDENDVLLQQRALTKYHTPGLWANACCTHPFWDERPIDCAHRRLDQELNIKVPELTFADQVEYRAEVGNDLIEHELVDIFVGNFDHTQAVSVNLDEVARVQWVSLHDLVRQIELTPEQFTPWLRIYLRDHSQKIFGDLS